jgi:hypothetical protein
MRDALISTVVLALVATLGDFVWARWLPNHTAAAGVTHGALLFLIAGAMLGLPHRRPGMGAVWGLLAGVIGAGVFYALAPAMRMMAMFPAWFVLWIVLGLATVMALRGARQPLEGVARGVGAGLLSGATFYLVSGMWQNWNPATIDYADHLWRWAVAFLPAFVCLQAARSPLARR